MAAGSCISGAQLGVVGTCMGVASARVMRMREQRHRRRAWLRPTCTCPRCQLPCTDSSCRRHAHALSATRTDCEAVCAGKALQHQA
jgi:hypothetical protein